MRDWAHSQAVLGECSECVDAFSGLQRIVIALSGETVYTPQGERVELQEMMRRYPMYARLHLFQRLQSIRAMYGFNQLLNFFFIQTLFHLSAEPLKFFRFCIRDSVDQ